MKDRSYMLKVQENIEGNFSVLGLDRPSPDSLDLAIDSFRERGYPLLFFCHITINL